MERENIQLQKWAMHHGIDLAGTWQEKVRATADGTVISSGWEGSFGRVVRVQHRFGLETVYAHLARLDVKKVIILTGDVMVLWVQVEGLMVPIYIMRLG